MEIYASATAGSDQKMDNNAMAATEMQQLGKSKFNLQFA